MIATSPVKRGRGRPRKNPLPIIDAPKRGRGRPRKDASSIIPKAVQRPTAIKIAKVAPPPIKNATTPPRAPRKATAPLNDRIYTDEEMIDTQHKRATKREIAFKRVGVTAGHVLVHFGMALSLKGDIAFCALCRNWYTYERKLPVLPECSPK